MASNPRISLTSSSNTTRNNAGASVLRLAACCRKSCLTSSPRVESRRHMVDRTDMTYVERGRCSAACVSFRSARNLLRRPSNLEMMRRADVCLQVRRRTIDIGGGTAVGGLPLQGLNLARDGGWARLRDHTGASPPAGPRTLRAVSGGAMSRKVASETESGIPWSTRRRLPIVLKQIRPVWWSANARSSRLLSAFRASPLRLAPRPQPGEPRTGRPGSSADLMRSRGTSAAARTTGLREPHKPPSYLSATWTTFVPFAGFSATTPARGIT